MHSSANERVPVGASSQASCGLRLPPKPPGAPSANSEGIAPLLSKLLLWMRIACLLGSGFGIAQAPCDRRERGEGVGQDAGEFAPAPGGDMRRAENVGRRRRQVRVQRLAQRDRKRVVWGKAVSVRV